MASSNARTGNTGSGSPTWAHTTRELTDADTTPPPLFDRVRQASSAFTPRRERRPKRQRDLPAHPSRTSLQERTPANRRSEWVGEDSTGSGSDLEGSSGGGAASTRRAQTTRRGRSRLRGTRGARQRAYRCRTTLPAHRGSTHSPVRRRAGCFGLLRPVWCGSPGTSLRSIARTPRDRTPRFAGTGERTSERARGPRGALPRSAHRLGPGSRSNFRRPPRPLPGRIRGALDSGQLGASPTAGGLDSKPRHSRRATTVIPARLRVASRPC
jgi:hypothetical protein